MNNTRWIAALAIESSSFLSLFGVKEEDKCLIWNKTFRRKDKTHCFGVNSWPKFKEQTEKWSKLKIHKDQNQYVHTLVHRRLNDTEEATGKSHGSCCREFNVRYIWYKIHKFLWVIFLGYLL